MKSPFQKRRPAPTDTMPGDAAVPGQRFQQAIASISQQASVMGREAAEVRGVIEDSGKQMGQRADLVSALAGQVDDVLGAQQAIGSNASAGVLAMDRARDAVEAVAGEVAGIVATLRQVAEAAAQITQIAVQTRLVAFNALVEAKRAGEAGRSFAVVAAEVKKLAHDTRASTSEIAGTIASLTKEAEMVTSEIKTGVEQSRVAQSSFSKINDTVRDVADIVALVDRQTDGIAQSTSHIQQSVDSVKSGLSSFAADARANGGQLKATRERLSGIEGPIHATAER